MSRGDFEGVQGVDRGGRGGGVMGVMGVRLVGAVCGSGDQPGLMTCLHLRADQSKERCSISISEPGV